MRKYEMDTLLRQIKALELENLPQHHFSCGDTEYFSAVLREGTVDTGQEEVPQAFPTLLGLKIEENRHLPKNKVFLMQGFKPVAMFTLPNPPGVPDDD